MAAAAVLLVTTLPTARASDAAASSQVPFAATPASTGWSGGNRSRVWVEVAATGNYSVSLGDSLWFQSGATEITINGTTRTSADGGLILVATKPIQGTDQFGPFTGVVQSWESDPVIVLETTFKIDPTGSSLRFGTTVPVAVEGASISAADGEQPTIEAWGTPSTAFPSFAVGKGKLGTGLGFVSYSEIGEGALTGVFPRGFKPEPLASGGVPLGLLDPDSFTAAVLSPVTKFYDTVFGFAPNGVNHTLRCGVAGTAERIPPGWATEVVLHYTAAGLTSTMLSWGDLLLSGHGKSRPSPSATVQVAQLGLSTVGHYFYGLHKGMNMEKTLTAVAETSRAAGLHFGYILIDSFWYREYTVSTPSGGTDKGFNGVWRWDDQVARVPEMFPSGLAALRNTVGVPFVMHIGEWVGNTSEFGPPPYTRNASWEWVVDKAGSVPRPGSVGGRLFWDELFRWMAAGGLTTYKLDHSQQTMPDVRYLLKTLGATATWLSDMAAAAAAHNITKQYGGHISSGFMHSVELPNAVVARCSYDYSPFLDRPTTACKAPSNIAVSQPSNVLIGTNSLYPWAMGLVPYKDAFLSGPQRWENTTCELWMDRSSYTFPEWWGLQEAYPELHLIVAALTAGPVAPGDGIGDTDAELVLRSCMANGTLLKPDRPALALDAVWHNKVFGAGGANGEVTHTGTSLSGRNAPGFGWHTVLGVALSSPFTVTTSDLMQTDVNTESHVVAWRRRAKEPWALPVMDAGPTPIESVRLPLPEQDSAEDWGRYTLWHTAEVSCDGRGWALLGEWDKAIPVSQQRFTKYTEECGAVPTLRIVVTGTVGEVVHLAFLSPNSVAVKAVNATVGAQGSAIVLVG